VLSFLFREGDRSILIQVAKARYALNDEPEMLRYILDRTRVTEAPAG